MKGEGNQVFISLFVEQLYLFSYHHHQYFLLYNYCVCNVAFLLIIAICSVHYLRNVATHSFISPMQLGCFETQIDSFAVLQVTIPIK